MPLVSSTITNLVGGISQQPAPLRLTNACENMLNTWPSIVSGLQKRPPTRHIANIGSALPSGVCGYLIERNTGYRYLALLSDGEVKVLDLNTGAFQTVNYPNGKAYLSAGSPVDAFRFVTFGDFTFIANRNITVGSFSSSLVPPGYAPDGTVSTIAALPSLTTEGLVYYVTSADKYYRNVAIPAQPAQYGWLKTSTPDPSYTYIYVGYSLPKATSDTQHVRITPTAFYDSYLISPATPIQYEWQEIVIEPSEVRLNPANMGTVYVTQAIANTNYSVYVNGVLKAATLTPKGVDASSAVPDTSVIASALRDDLVANGYSVTKTGSTLTITNLPDGAILQTQGGTGDKSVRAFTTDVQSFSDLPPTSPQGRIVRVAGKVEEAGDDYYVIYDNGVWRETLNYGAGEVLDASTMPHVLVREADGTWTFKQHKWMGRSVGDEDSARTPSFVNTQINDIFVYTNRLGFLADENIILSEADNFENFYRTTCAQLIDSDLIDLAVLHSNVDIIYHAVAYNRDLLLMSEKNQFRFTYQNFLGQKTSNVQYSTSFNVSTRVPPLNIGNSVYFVDDRSDYVFSKVYEFFPKDNSTVDDADEVSAPIPEFIKTNVRFTAASNRAKCFIVYSENDASSIYVYKFFWSGDRKVQSAWTKWSFSDCNRIYWADFSGTYLYILIERPNGVFLERMRLDEDVFDTDINYEIMLDRRYTLLAGNMTYDAVNDKTAIVLPFQTSGTIEVVSSDTVNGVYGIRQPVTKLAANEFTVPGNITGYTNTVGLSYTMLYEFSTLFAKQAKNSGEVVMLDGRTQIRYLTVQYHNTAYFQTKLITPGRADNTSTFVGFVVGSEEAELGKQPFASGKYRIPVMSENLKARIQLYNDSPFPSAFGSAEWQGIISPKSVQRL